MSKPEDVPQDVWDEATQHVAQIPIRSQRAWDLAKSIIARAIMAAEKRGEEREREACALIAEVERRSDLSIKHGYKPTWFVVQNEIAAAIRNRTAS